MSLSETGRSDPENIYNRMPYPQLSFAQSHPTYLATLATLLGMDPPPVDRCRVLELGCAVGGNIIPMAYSLPHSRFVGIDLSSEQIARGQAMATELGLANLRLEERDILAVGPDFGQFDYIIAHGVFSWVPPQVQHKILEICRRNLAPTGVAYVSYNIYPGWHMLRGLREMMLYHTRRAADPQSQVTESRQLLDFLAHSIPAESSPFAGLFHAWINLFSQELLPKNDAALLHDELSPVNEPLYFHQFAELLERHGLRYLADAQFQAMLASNLPPEVAQALRQMAQTTTEVEQYLDFLYNRAFRQSLLCHQEVSLTARVSPERLARFHVASPALPETREPDLQAETALTFKARDGAELTTNHPLTKAALLHLTRLWPRTMPFNDLLATANEQIHGHARSSEQDRLLLASNLLQAFGRSDHLIEFQVHPAAFVPKISRRPVASPVARVQARDNSSVTNLRHERIQLDGLNRRLLPYLDGRHDLNRLHALLAAWADEGFIEMKSDDTIGGDSDKNREAWLDEVLQAKLEQLARASLLVG